jgi:hypothetical protein
LHLGNRWEGIEVAYQAAAGDRLRSLCGRLGVVPCSRGHVVPPDPPPGLRVPPPPPPPVRGQKGSASWLPTIRPGRGDTAHGSPHQKRPRAAASKETLPAGQAGILPVRASPPPPPAPPARAPGAPTPKPCGGSAAPNLARCDDSQMETSTDTGGRKRGAAGPATLASPAMDLEETEGEPDICMHVPVEGGPLQALTVVTVESSSEEASEPGDQPTATSTSQGEAAGPVDSLPNRPMPQVALGGSPTSPADSSSGTESSSESSTRLAPAVSPGLARPPDPPTPCPPSSSSVTASYSPSPISIDPNEL